MADFNTSDLSDTTIIVDADAIDDICDTWNQKVASVDLSSIDVNSSFSALIGCDIATEYIPSLENALGRINSLVSSISNIIKSAADEQVEVDESASNNNNTNGGANNNNNGNNSNNSNNNNGTYYPNGSSVDNSSEDLTINTELVATINGLDYISYSSLMSSLASCVTNEMSLTSILSNVENADIIKKILLEDVNVSNELKQIITNMDSKILQASLLSCLKDGSVLIDSSKSILYTYLERLAKANNLTLTDVVKNQNALVQTFNDFESVSNIMDTLINSNKVSDGLLNIYDGNTSASDNSVIIIRDMIESIAESKNITPEALLIDSSNKDYLNSSVMKFAKEFKYISTVGYTDLDTVSTVLSNIVTAS